MNLNALNALVKETKQGGGGLSSELRKKWQTPTLDVGDEITFSIVETHKHQVSDDMPFVPVVHYRLSDSSSKYGKTTVIPKSSFDDTLKDPVAFYLGKLKEEYKAKTGSDQLPKELYKSLMPTTYIFVPVVIQNRENEGIKWLRLSPPTFEELIDLIGKWYDFDAKKGVDFILKRADKTKYSISPAPRGRAIDTIDKGILEASLEELPSLEEILFISDDQRIQEALQENLKVVSGVFEEEGDITYGSEYKKEDLKIDASMKNKIDDLFPS